MITVLINFSIKEAHLKKFKDLTLKNLADRGSAKGAIKMQLFQEMEDLRKFTMIEAFDSQENIDAYYVSENYKNWHNATFSMIHSIRGNDAVRLY